MRLVVDIACDSINLAECVHILRAFAARIEDLHGTQERPPAMTYIHKCEEVGTAEFVE